MKVLVHFALNLVSSLRILKSIVRKQMSSLQLQELNSVSYNDIFSDSEAQLKKKVFEVIILIWEVLGTPAYPGQNTGADGK